MIQEVVPVLSREQVADGLFVLTVRCSRIANSVRGGQFLNVRVSAGVSTPLLRRPFSVSRAHDDSLELLFNIVGGGTRLLASKGSGDQLDILGPLGVPFRADDEYETALIVAGGLGIAPFPLLTEELLRFKKNVKTFVGARTTGHVYVSHLREVHIATDDGSDGFHGNVIQLLEHYLKHNRIVRPKIFGCGPTKMLKALSESSRQQGIQCELSLEGEMACGIGICQGCPVERVNGPKKYALMCTEGPTFNSTEVVL